MTRRVTRPNAYARKDDAPGDKLMRQAQDLDPDAVEDTIDDLEEDAPAEHDLQGLKRQLDSKPE